MIALQSPAERRLMQALAKEFPPQQPVVRLLDIGANTSTVIESFLAEEGVKFVCDRTDVSDPSIAPEGRPWLGQSHVAPVEDMKPLSSGVYQGAFANFVLEHVERVDKAVQEINRVLAPGGLFACSIPNPQAPEFMLSRHTPHEFHQFVRGYGEGDEAEAHHTHYHYKSIDEFIAIFKDQGFTLEGVWYDPATYVYLHRFPIINYASKAYDWLVAKLVWKRFLGAVCIVFRKK